MGKQIPKKIICVLLTLFLVAACISFVGSADNSVNTDTSSTDAPTIDSLNFDPSSFIDEITGSSPADIPSDSSAISTDGSNDSTVAASSDPTSETGVPFDLTSVVDPDTGEVSGLPGAATDSSDSTEITANPTTGEVSDLPLDAGIISGVVTPTSGDSDESTDDVVIPVLNDENSEIPTPSHDSSSDSDSSLDPISTVTDDSKDNRVSDTSAADNTPVSDDSTVDTISGSTDKTTTGAKESDSNSDHSTATATDSQSSSSKDTSSDCKTTSNNAKTTDSCAVTRPVDPCEETIKKVDTCTESTKTVDISKVSSNISKNDSSSDDC